MASDSIGYPRSKEVPHRIKIPETRLPSDHKEAEFPLQYCMLIILELRRRALNDNQIDHILASIDEIDPTIDANTPERQETLIHNFGVFDACLSTLHSLKNDGLTTDQELFHHTGFPEIASPPSEPLGLPVDPSPPETSFTFVSDLSSDHLVPLWYPSDEEVAFQDNSLISPAIQELTPNKPKVSQTSCDIDEDISSQRGFLHVDSRYFRWREPNGTIMSNPSPTYLPPLEQFLLHHYMRRVSTGEMNIEGSTSHIQHALRNALLSISAFTLSNDSTSRGNHDEANRWANEAMIFRGKTFKLLKDSVERGFQSESSPKYKDYLATMLSMISINVTSSDIFLPTDHLREYRHKEGQRLTISALSYKLDDSRIF
ncbi:fungal-specific transcription factor domain-containing protein [Penicillium pulvis]|uniref:fungal-specific transcription factor domain-containing protein n=1 Tax=Penicillium pulvis TaxID=1562058 RepID=UPI002546FB25|nr:fungal-specific transcription factor domain-containing protein [Penicillium pulvis]KAJ5786796.1 fungal-specific transcription factor domain-containing protein [Penicillium pulvis]